ncbi:dienelactone hydrolase family protein [Sphingomonas lutea]|uniref:Dienelactone hydrolase family protein n=1 Tax=Sphingomonas lutea TaxID=1045317 RepID=A0A7G9SK30_9SPHN|nr:dienelactone hydrolase family protein [Sphingomonas lutea]QNN68205.1 dienelactone hydrolase family protein [Sphingomonas lutea]
MSRETEFDLDFNGETLRSVFVGRRDNAVRPTIMLIPTVMGVSELELGFGRQLVELGYSAFVADLFGRRFRPGVDREAAFAAMGKLKSDRAALRERLLALLDQMRGLEAVDPARIAVAGYCFGGMCALDIARSGADVAAAVAFHGLFDPAGLPPQPIKAKVVAFHGWDDPMVPPDAVVALGRELTEAGADWQIHAYGQTQHGFTNPGAQGAIPGVHYQPIAAERSWTSFISLLEEVFG